MEENQANIPEGWELESLGKVVSFSTGKKDVNQGNPEGDYPFFTCSKTFTFSDEYSFDEEALMVAGNGDVGTVHYYNGKFEAYQRTYVLRNLKLDVQFLFQLLKSELIPYLLSGQSGTTIQFIKIGQLTGFQFLKPKSKPEQTQIATILSKVDEAIFKTKKLIAKYSRIKTGLMQDFLTKGVDENGNIRSEETHEFKDSPLGRIPIEWECEKLERYGSFSKGSTISKSLLSDNGVNCILYGELYTKYDIYATEIFSKVPFEFVIEKQPLKYGDILFAGSGETHEDIGKCITFIGNKPTYAGGDIVIFRSKHFNPIFLSMLLNSFKLNIQKSALGQGSSVIHIYPNHLKMLDVIFPDKVEQDRIAEIILKNEMYINDLETNLSKLYSLKTGLMQDLLSGKVRVNHLIKETANV